MRSREKSDSNVRSMHIWRHGMSTKSLAVFSNPCTLQPVRIEPVMVSSFPLGVQLLFGSTGRHEVHIEVIRGPHAFLEPKKQDFLVST